MDIQGLKDKVLQLAIQGKLVEQCESDEPASVLLDRIKKEKEQLVKDKIIKKEKTLQEISNDEKSFEIPNTWEWCRLGNICKQITDGAHKTPKYIDSGIPFLSVKNISKGYLDFSDIKYISEEEHNSLISRCNPQRNDLLFCRIGTLGRFKVIDTDTKFSIFVSLGLIKLSDNICPKYMEYVLNSPELYIQYYKIKVDGSHTSKLNLRDIPNLKIPLPPLEEQKRIVTKVDELFKLIDELDKNKQDLLKNITNTRNKVLQLAIQGKLVKQFEEDEPASVLLDRIKKEKEQLVKDKVIKKEKALPEVGEDEKLFDLPRGWEWCRLQNLAMKITDGSHNPPRGEVDKTEYFMLSSQNINKNTIVNLEKSRYLSEENYNLENKRTQINIGDMLLTIVGTIGRSCIYNLLQKITLQRSVAVIDTKYCNVYLKYLFDSPQIQKYFNENASGTAQRGIYLNRLKQVAIPLPPLDEQKRIVSKVDLIMNYLDNLQQEIESQEIVLKELAK